MRAFVTGASGFVGGWLVAHLRAMGDEVAELDPAIDLGDSTELEAALKSFSPEVIYHLAAFTHVGRSWQEPKEAFRVNALGTLDLLEATRSLTAWPRVLLVSSAEVYGRGEGVALTEDALLAPVTPYASSKIAAEYVSVQAHLGRGLEVVLARPFNHIGPGQNESFVVSGLARRVVEAERSGSPTIAVGNLSPARDFTDVRDVVRAYRMLAEQGLAGSAYNVCSGKAVTIAEVLEELVALAKITIEPQVDQDLMRPVDVPILLGDASRLEKLTGWRPQIDLRTTLADVLADWRAREH